MGLSFRIANIPVQVVPSFFWTAVLLGGLGGDIAHVAAWVAIVFVSVLAHELGHAGACVLFGLRPAVQIHGFGGTTVWAAASPLPVGRRVLISLAGPVAGFVLAAAVIGLGRAAGDRVFASHLGVYVYGTLLYVNIVWGVFNLLPILPLDGGNVLLHVLNATTGGRGEPPARLVSLVAATLVGLLAFKLRQPYLGLLALSFIVNNWRAVRALDQR
ncbi:MAG: site-2 protease family protein [Polyangiaceae bacterium]|nr:site-2 protease family protein [Polyangiaceae bacterium]